MAASVPVAEAPLDQSLPHLRASEAWERARAAPSGGGALGSGGAGPLGMAGDSPRFLKALPAEHGPEPVRTRVQEQDLQQWGLTGEPAGEARGRAGAGMARGSAGLRGDSLGASSFPAVLAPPRHRLFPLPTGHAHSLVEAP